MLGFPENPENQEILRTKESLEKPESRLSDSLNWWLLEPKYSYQSTGDQFTIIILQFSTDRPGSRLEALFSAALSVSSISNHLINKKKQTKRSQNERNRHKNIIKAKVIDTKGIKAKFNILQHTIVFSWIFHEKKKKPSYIAQTLIQQK